MLVSRNIKAGAFVVTFYGPDYWWPDTSKDPTDNKSREYLIRFSTGISFAISSETYYFTLSVFGVGFSIIKIRRAHAFSK